MNPIILSFVLLFFCFLSFFISRKIKKKNSKMKEHHKIQKGKITYTDLNKPANIFFSKKYRIAGKPDYIIKKNDIYIPVELKTGSNNKPMKNHIFQLASYCHLLEENYGTFVPYGILVYNNQRSYEIKYNPRIRYELESTINKMRQTIKTGNIVRNHNDILRCKNCSMKKYCKEKITL